MKKVKVMSRAKFIRHRKPEAGDIQRHKDSIHQKKPEAIQHPEEAKDWLAGCPS